MSLSLLLTYVVFPTHIVYTRSYIMSVCSFHSLSFSCCSYVTASISMMTVVLSCDVRICDEEHCPSMFAL